MAYAIVAVHPDDPTLRFDAAAGGAQDRLDLAWPAIARVAAALGQAGALDAAPFAA